LPAASRELPLAASVAVLVQPQVECRGDKDELADQLGWLLALPVTE
jgi:hypothetical protein